MGFFDKIKDTANKIKEENKNFGQTMKRMNGPSFFGTINRDVKEGDFWQGSYINVDNGQGLIYGSAQDDYTFTADDIASFKANGNGKVIAVGNAKLTSNRFVLTFTDGKTAQADIRSDRVQEFLQAFQK